jgi:hypothetical protein
LLTLRRSKAKPIRPDPARSIVTGSGASRKLTGSDWKIGELMYTPAGAEFVVTTDGLVGVTLAVTTFPLGTLALPRPVQAVVANMFDEGAGSVDVLYVPYP